MSADDGDLEPKGSASSLGTWLSSDTAGELDPDGFRWTTVGVPIPALWLYVVNPKLWLPSAAGNPPPLDPAHLSLELNAYVAPQAFAGVATLKLAMMPLSAWNANFAASNATLPAPWTWGADEALQWTSHTSTSPDAESTAKVMMGKGALVVSGGSIAEVRWDFTKGDLYPASCPGKAGHGNLQALAAYSNTNRRATWEYRRRTAPQLNTLAVGGEAFGAKPQVRVGFTDQTSQLYFSTDSAQSFAALGSTLESPQVAAPADWAALADAPSWKSQGYSNIVGAAVGELPPIDEAAKPSTAGSRFVLALTDDGGVSRARMDLRTLALEPWEDVHWNLPRNATHNDLADGIADQGFGNSLYFDGSAGGLPTMRWPVGLFTLAKPVDPSALAPTFTAGSTTNQTDWKAVFEPILQTTSAAVTPPTFAGACFGSPDTAPATATLVSVAFNLCCGPQRYFFVGASPHFLYVGRTGGGLKRLPLGEL